MDLLPFGAKKPDKNTTVTGSSVIPIEKSLTVNYNVVTKTYI